MNARERVHQSMLAHEIGDAYMSPNLALFSLLTHPTNVKLIHSQTDDHKLPSFRGMPYLSHDA